MQIEASRYENSNKNWWTFDPKFIALENIPSGSEVLDVGCSFGEFGRRLFSRNCIVDGIELDPKAAESAKKILRNCWIGSIERDDFIEKHVASDQYDFITLMDVLEHCAEPELVLRRLSRCLKKNGRFIISLPNVVNLRTRMHILRGNFDYQEYGVLDKTHLRFYTPSSAVGMIQSSVGNAKIIGYTPCFDRLARITGIWPAGLALHTVLEAVK